MESEKLNILKKEIKEKQISFIKDIVKNTLEKIHDLEKEKNVIQNSIKILRHDLFDLKEGRLDRILERQSMEEDIKKISCFEILPSDTLPKNTSSWYVEYIIKYNECEIRLNNSITKINASGSYKIKDDVIKYL